MSEPTQITDPHLGTLLTLAQERAAAIGGQAGAIIDKHAQECALVINGYLRQMHEANNQCMAMQKTIEELKKPPEA